MDERLVRDIKFNCDVSDAQFWGYYSVCGLLMRYRDLYRSEQGQKPWSTIDRAAIASWIERKEARWPELEHLPFRDLIVEGKTFGPFETEGINERLVREGLVYGAGYAMYMKPTFFVAELRSVREVEGLTVYTTGRELVRDLFTAPAMLQDRTVSLRLEPLVMLLLYKQGELGTKPGSLLSDAFSAYGFRDQQILDSTLEERLTGMAEKYAEVLLRHEVAEHAEGAPEWRDILALTAGDRQAEHYLRALKDLLADTSPLGPYARIIADQDQGALGLSLALTEGFRRLLFPELREAYGRFRESGEWMVMEQVRAAGYERFRSRRDEVVDLYGRGREAEGFLRELRELMRGPQ